MPSSCALLSVMNAYRAIARSIIPARSGPRIAARPADDRNWPRIPIARVSSLADGEKHGYAILKEVEQRTNGSVVLSTGTLYGIIKRLLADGLIRESAAGSDDRRTAYRLTAFGRKAALAEAERLRELVIAAQDKKLLTGFNG